MLDFLRDTQLSMMLILTGMCGLTAIFVMLLADVNRTRRQILFFLEMGAMVLLVADRYAYL